MEFVRLLVLISSVSVTAKGMVTCLNHVYTATSYFIHFSAQVFPAQYSYVQVDVAQINGSSLLLGCSSVGYNGGTVTCNTPFTSVLFDENIPTLTGLDGDMWASQLLIMRTRLNRLAMINFDFAGTPLGFSGVSRLEVVFFNCEAFSTSVQTIRLQSNQGVVFGTVDPMINSCHSLVRVCMPNLNIDPTNTELDLIFLPHTSSKWVHVAEVTFHDIGSTCPLGTATTTTTTGMC